MKPFPESMQIYRNQLEQGALQAAYRGLMAYMSDLRSHFQKTCPEYAVPGGIYPGTMDMTYFSVVPEALKQRKLKIAVVFLHQEFRFEVWLSGSNRQVQADYWKLLKERDWTPYRLVADPRKADSILEFTLVEDPDFGDLDGLTAQIERGTLKFIADMEGLLEE